MQSAAQLEIADSTISSSNFTSSNWYDADVPGTVLGSLVSDSVYKDIFFHRNLEKIPDSRFDTPWWYRKTFKIGRLQPGQRARLQFNGINYRADIWLNGHKIASADTTKGGFRRFTINVSKAIHEGENILAVKVTRPKPGEPTLGFVDWNPNPPDHNMGIWRDVHLQLSGPVSIDQPFVQSKVDTSTLDYAKLTISTRLQNHSNKKIHGFLKGTIDSGRAFMQEVTLDPKSPKEITFSPDQFSQLRRKHPKLWWVHTMGKPNLHNLHLTFTTNKQLSDSQNVRFGIRSVSDYMTPDGHRGYKLNGKKILIKGGGWTDPMLLNATPEYERAGIDYAVQMNLNTIRMEGFWGQNQHLYDLCDEKGILIMVGYSAEWEWEGVFGAPADKYGGIQTPEQMAVASQSWKDQVIWLRNHPSIFLRLYGSDKTPRPALEKQYLKILNKYDPDRPHVASAKEHTSSLTGRTAVKMRGPYDYVPPNYWYADTTYGGAFGFNTETGPGPQIPVRESLEKMIPADSLWPIGSAWMYHAARGKFHNLKNYNRAMQHRLGKPNNLDDYLRKAQYLNYEGMRAMFEAFEANRYKATGIIQWMFNASWPKLWWQLYDYYLMPTGAFYGARKANEAIHIAYNYKNNAIDVMNNTLKMRKSLSAEIRVLNFNLDTVLKKTIPVKSLQERQTKEIYAMPSRLELSRTWFADLRLYSQGHQLQSRNFYALSTQKDKLDEANSTWFITPESQYADLKMLQQLHSIGLQADQTVEQEGDTTFVHVTLKNPTSQLAFMVHLDLKKGKNDESESVVPIFWDQNYISLLPGEKRTISGYCYTNDLDGQQPFVNIDGWNVNQSITNRRR